MAHIMFANGTQYLDWQAANCERCAKSYLVTGADEPTCEIENAIEMAAIDDGSVSDDIARRSGMLDHLDHYCWPCNEVEWSQEWVAEWKRRHPGKEPTP